MSFFGVDHKRATITLTPHDMTLDVAALRSLAAERKQASGDLARRGHKIASDAALRYHDAILDRIYSLEG
jgi:hypothetical protein